MFELLHNEDAASLAQYEPVPMGVEGPHSLWEGAFLGRKAPQSRIDVIEGFADLIAPSGEDYLSIALLQQVEGEYDGALHGGFFVGKGGIDPPDSELQGAVAADGVGHGGLKEKRSRTRWSLFDQAPVVEIYALGTSQARSNHDSNPVGIFFFQLQARIVQGHPYCGDRHLSDTVHPPQIGRFDIFPEIDIGQLSTQFRIHVAYVEAGDGPDSALTMNTSLPEGTLADPDGADHPDTRNDDSIVHG